MPTKPVVVYIEDESGSGIGSRDFGNPNREALMFVMETDYGCEVLPYKYKHYFEEDFDRVRSLARCNHLVMVIIKQERYSEGEHFEMIAMVRQLSSVIPIVVIPDGWDEGRFEGIAGDELVYASDGHTDPKIAEMLELAVKKFKPQVNRYGATTRQDQVILLEQLAHAYEVHNLGDNEENMLGIPDYNSRAVLEALRVSLIPVQFLREEFDDTLKREHVPFVEVEASVYEQELARLKAMTTEELKQLDYKLLTAQGYQPHPGGGIIKVRTSCGSNVSGFAIDHVTFSYLITRDFGLHHAAADLLKNRVRAIDAHRRRRHELDTEEDEERRSMSGRIIQGLIFREIEGFKTPILDIHCSDVRMTGIKREDAEKVAEFVKRQKMFLPLLPPPLEMD